MDKKIDGNKDDLEIGMKDIVEDRDGSMERMLGLNEGNEKIEKRRIEIDEMYRSWIWRM